MGKCACTFFATSLFLHDNATEYFEHLASFPILNDNLAAFYTLDLIIINLHLVQRVYSSNLKYFHYNMEIITL